MASKRPSETARQRAERLTAQLNAEKAAFALREFRAAKREMLALGDYNAARRTRLKSGRRPWVGSGDAHLDQPTLTALRTESQRAARNNPVARAMLRRLRDCVIGRGMTLQVTASDREWALNVQDRFTEWFETQADVRGLLSGSAMQGMVFEAMLRDGDVGTLQCLTERGHQLQIVEGDLIGNPNGVRDSDTMVNGVETDAWGRPVAYHVAQYQRTGSGIKPGSWRRLEASNFIFLAHLQRPSQTRGEPALAASIDLLNHLDRLIEAVIVAMRVAACQAMVVKRNFPGLAQNSLLGGVVQRGDGTVERRLEIQPGAVTLLNPGEEMEQFRPEHPHQQFDQMARTLIRMVGTDLYLPLELVLLDYSQTNFHSARSASAQAYRGFDAMADWFRSRWLRPIYRWWVGEQMAMGRIEWREDWADHNWIAPPRPVFDPKAEAEATLTRINGNLETLDEALSREGRDIREVLVQRALEVAEQDRLNITPPGLPGQQPTQGPAADAQPAQAPAASPAAPTPQGTPQ